MDKEKNDFNREELPIGIKPLEGDEQTTESLLETREFLRPTPIDDDSQEIKLVRTQPIPVTKIEEELELPIQKERIVPTNRSVEPSFEEVSSKDPTTSADLPRENPQPVLEDVKESDEPTASGTPIIPQENETVPPSSEPNKEKIPRNIRDIIIYIMMVIIVVIIIILLIKYCGNMQNDNRKLPTTKTTTTLAGTTTKKPQDATLTTTTTSTRTDATIPTTGTTTAPVSQIGPTTKPTKPTTTITTKPTTTKNTTSGKTTKPTTSSATTKPTTTPTTSTTTTTVPVPTDVYTYTIEEALMGTMYNVKVYKNGTVYSGVVALFSSNSFSSFIASGTSGSSAVIPVPVAKYNLKNGPTIYIALDSECEHNAKGDITSCSKFYKATLK